ncbi:DNA polymerase beta domain protein region [Methanohalobium evestigatum Z-7303]|uniref:DNA polymerase beta domain protein region n=1 Tax=Methanohalobium evestigatum (strain ATCC BAA-1072 / DSM 3721 / NBRC 107634 / OCM 161 / Z-7303) TaxID=644295 RepID=D7E7J6_METEZ|nr:nucleotidyltransferase domain-containing protein [Methanohalobium evestigatum]ADI74069.1 DNA polymerase beta domain protein region [Methanohalobium evestigatum Z-7303]
MIEKSDIIKKLEDYFTAKDEVILAYLFGSVAKGESNRLSDVDVAVLLDESLTKQEMFDLELKFIDDIVGILKVDDIDLTIMNLAPLTLNFNIIKQGYILKSDENKRVRFETYLMSRYLDEKYYRERYMRESLKKMIEARENE